MDPCHFFLRKIEKLDLHRQFQKIFLTHTEYSSSKQGVRTHFPSLRFDSMFLPMPNPSVNSPKKKSDSPQFEIAALKKTFVNFLEFSQTQHDRCLCLQQ